MKHTNIAAVGLISALCICTTGSHAQTLHLNDLLQAYSLDSGAFKAFCLQNGYDQQIRYAQAPTLLKFRSGKDEKRTLEQSFPAEKNVVPSSTIPSPTNKNTTRWLVKSGKTGFL